MFDFLIQSAHAAAGIELSDSGITGALRGLAESAGTLQTTVNNQYFITLAVMFIGFAVIIGLLYHQISHKGSICTSKKRVFEVPISSLYEPTGSYKVLKGKNALKRYRDPKGYENEPILLSRYNNRLIVRDGMHRIAKRHRRGEKNIKATFDT